MDSWWCMVSELTPLALAWFVSCIVPFGALTLAFSFVSVPPDKFEFNLLAPEQQQQQEQSSSPLLRCSVERVFPRPVLTFSELLTGGSVGNVPAAASANGAQFHSFPSVEVTSIVNGTTGLYSAWFEYRLAMDSIRVGTVYECKLELPSTAYVRKKRIKLIYPSSKFPHSGTTKCTKIQ